MISISHAPNSTRSQRQLAWRWLMPWKRPHRKQGGAFSMLESQFQQRFNAAQAVSFATGREALLAVFKALGIASGDEVIIQAYTCIVVPHAVVWSGATPLYADIDATLNLSPEDVVKKITPKTKAIVVQHTFGVPANMKFFVDFCKANNLLLIEDVAHALGARYENREVGSFGDAAIFSFGRDKVISSTSGGMAIAKHKDHAQRLREIQQQGAFPHHRWIKQNLWHPILIPWCLSYMQHSPIGGLMLRLFQSIGLLNKVYTPREMQSETPQQGPRRMPNALAALALQQLNDDAQNFAAHRSALADLYGQWAKERGIQVQNVPANAHPAWLRYTIFVEHPHHFVEESRKHGFVLGDWYSHVITPRPVDANRLNYKQGSCPKAEAAAKTSLNLPTHHLMHTSDVQTLLSGIESLL